MGMLKAEIGAQQQCSGPKTDALPQGVQRIATVGKLFKKTHEQENGGPFAGPADNCEAVQRQGTEGVAAQRGESADEQRNFAEAEEAALPEMFAKSASYRQAVAAGGGALDAREHLRCAVNHGESGQFLDEQELR